MQRKRAVKKMLGGILTAIAILSIAVINKTEKVQAYEVSGFYQYELNDTGVTITKYTGGESDVVIPSKIAGRNVMVIGNSAFKNNDLIGSVKIPTTVKTIEAEAFQDCDSLQEITIPNSVTEIKNGGWYSASTFENCDNLIKVVIGDGVIGINDSCFQNCPKLKVVTIGKKVEYIGGNAFQDCVSLDNVTIPPSVKTIGGSAFKNCDSLINLTLSYGLRTIETEAFWDCDSLQEITIPNSVTEIKNGGWYSASTFENCDNLRKVIIGDGVIGINDSCFQNCPKLQVVTIGKKVEYIGGNAFQDCVSLDNVTIPPSVKTIGASAFKNCDSLINLTLSYGLRTIEVEAFWDCDSLQEITIPNSVTEIKNGGWYSASTFENCDNLISVRIPNSVSNIGDSLLYNSKNAAIYGYSGSAAEAYALQNKYPFIELPAVPSTSFQFGKKEILLYAGQQADIDYEIKPEATTDAVIWMSSNPDIASVDNLGRITAKAPGSVSIIATTTGGLKQNLTVIVNEAPKSITFTYPSRILIVGKSFTQKALLDYGQRTDVTVTYSSSDSSIAIVNASGKVTAKKAGTAIIRARIFNGLEVSCLVSVANPPSSVALNVKSIVLRTQESYQLTPKIPDDSYTSKYTYKSSNSSVAVINSQGRIVAKKKGITVITVTTDNGKKAACKVTVK